jgi:uncharacterized membrane protein YphA (DoxX/SURF4 family)
MTHPDATATTPPTYSAQFDRARDVAAPSHTSEWHLGKRVGFRFLFAYFLLYTYPGPLDEIPYTSFLAAPYNWLWRAVVPWIGKHVLHLSQPVSLLPSGSGDRMFNWVQVFAMLSAALVVAVVWTALEKRHRSHPKLFAGLKLYLRFYLASTMFGYGFDKIIPNQFEPMNPVRLTQYIGEAAPGGFAWSFLGFSILYEVFAGLGETVAGLLLLVRRTSTLGAIVGAAVLTNVFMLNMSYDIPVKQFSGHLLLMCVYLVACDAGRLLDVFVRGRGTSPSVETELFATPRSLLLARVAGFAFSIWMLGAHIWNENQGLHQYGRLAPRGPLYGIFDVERVVKNGVLQAPLLTDMTRWRRLASGNRGTAIRMATDSLVRFRLVTDSVKRIATFTSFPDTANKAVLAYSFPDSTHLVLRGTAGVDSVEMTLKRRREDSYLLMKRGFHWVNEVPYFR